MTISSEITRPPILPEAAQRMVAELLSGKYLGASRNIRQINDLLVCIAREWNTDSGKDLAAALCATGDYLIATRGRNTPAICNAIRLILHGIDPTTAGDVDEIRQLLETRQADLNSISLRNAELIADYGANFLAQCNVIMAFDYSSSQLAILRRLAERGSHKHIIVPESRALDGGRPIVREATACGHQVTYVVDLAFGHFLPQCDAVLIGAETITADGACWNTIGSYPIAMLAHVHQVPLYVATELIKIDPDSFAGIRRAIKCCDYSDLLKYPGSFERTELISVTAPDLEIVPANLITSYITPLGVMLPSHLRSEAQHFLESIGVSLRGGK